MKNSYSPAANQNQAVEFRHQLLRDQQQILINLQFFDLSKDVETHARVRDWQ